MNRRSFLERLVSPMLLGAAGCHAEGGYSDADEAELEAHRRRETQKSGQGPFGAQRYRGYRGLAELPYFELDERGRLRCIVEDLPAVVDIHAHLGMSLLFAPEIDLLARTDRVQHLLDCDASHPGCPLDLDVYINTNFSPDDLRALRWNSLAQLLWGSQAARTQTIPNLIAEMDATGVRQALILPIRFGLPFGDDLPENWTRAIREARADERLLPGASVHPRDEGAIEQLRSQAAAGARALKLHPPMQRFFPDAPEAHAIYEECGSLGLPVIFHGGRAGIEPRFMHPYAMMNRYEGALRAHPDVQFVLGHAGARDVEAAIGLAERYPNTWLGIHGQGVSQLARLIERPGADRLLFGTDWPFYHLAATLAKVLIVSEGRPAVRRAILRTNAERLLGPSSTG